MDEALQRVLDAVLDDLSTAGIAAPGLERLQGVPENTASVLLRSPDGSGTGLFLALSQAEQEQLASVADQVQEWAIEELAGRGLPTNWPRCPEHLTSHPLVARTCKGRAVWMCPVDGLAVASIGELGI